MSDHHKLIIEQFTQQAVPFSERAAQSHEEADRLVLNLAEVGPQDTALDVACGPGVLTCKVAQVARHVTGIDLTPAMIEQAQRRQKELGLDNLTWRVGDVLPLPFADASFSRVLTRYSFHHFLTPAVAFREMVRVCRPGGRVVVIDVFVTSNEQSQAYDQMEKLRDPSHVRALMLDELTGLIAREGLTDLKVDYYRLDVEVDKLLAASFPNEGDADRFRIVVEQDIGVNRLGIGARREDGILRFAFPVAVLVGRVPG